MQYAPYNLLYMIWNQVSKSKERLQFGGNREEFDLKWVDIRQVNLPKTRYVRIAQVTGSEIRYIEGDDQLQHQHGYQADMATYVHIGRTLLLMSSKKRPEAREIWSYRWKQKIPCTEHVINNGILMKMETKLSLAFRFRKKHLKCLGHIIREWFWTIWYSRNILKRTDVSSE